MTKSFPLVSCKSCGWVHFAVTDSYIDKWENEWIDIFKTASTEYKEAYGLKDSPPSQIQYNKCFRCSGSFRNFKDVKAEDIPRGSTIQPIRERTGRPPKNGRRIHKKKLKEKNAQK